MPASIGARPGAVVCIGQTGVNALATIRSLGRRGIPVHALRVEGSEEIASLSRYCASTTTVAHAGGLAAALRAIAKRLRGRAVLYIDNDALMRTLAPHAAQLGRLFHLVEPLADATRLTDKRYQLKIVRKLDVPAPATWFPRSWDEIERITPAGARLIAKPAPRDRARAGSDAFKTVVAASGSELVAQLKALDADPAEIIVQDYIEGDDSEVYVALCYRGAQGDAHIFSARKLRQTPAGAGVMALGRPFDAPQVRALTERIAAAIGLRGVLSTEFKLDPRSGELRFIEWNPRPGAFQSLGWQAGFDLAWLAYCDHAGLRDAASETAQARYDTGHRWINMRCELDNLVRAPSLALRSETWRPWLGKKEWALFALDDPAPWAKSTAQACAWLARGFARRLARGQRGGGAEPAVADAGAPLVGNGQHGAAPIGGVMPPLGTRLAHGRA